MAQTVVPDAGSLLRQNQRDTAPPQPVTAAPPLASPTPPPRPAPGDTGPRFVVSAFRFSGATLLPEAELQALLQPWLNRSLNFADLAAAGDALSTAYQRHGWLARAQLPAQDISEGTVTFQLIEGRLSSVVVTLEGDAGRPARASEAHVRALLLARQKIGAPLRLDDLTRATRLLNDTPGLTALVSLAPGAADGDSAVQVAVQDRPLWNGDVEADNAGARATGPARISLNAHLNNPGGSGDHGQLAASASRGNQYLRLAYDRALGPQGLRGGVQVSALRYRLIDAFAALQAHGDAQTLGVFAAYPLTRAEGWNAALSASLDAKAYRNVAGGSLSSQKSAQLASATLSGDRSGADNFSLWSINLSLGHLRLGDTAPSAQAADAAGPQTAGSFGKLTLSLAHQQRLAAGLSLWFSAQGQWADRNLDSAEKFSLGGPYGVRAYPSQEGQGDNGWLATAELRQSLAVLPGLEASLFYDAGRLTAVNALPGFAGAAARNALSLRGVGLGLRYSRPADFMLRATLAHRLGRNPLANPATGADSDGSEALYRLWISAVKFF